MHWIDPDCLPEVSGIIDRFLLNPDGEANGLMLRDGLEVHFPPHMASGVLGAVRSGAAVRIRGVRPRGVMMIAAISIAPPDGVPVVDHGPQDDGKDRKTARPQSHDARVRMELNGVVRQVLHGPKGEVRGVLLEDGRAGRFPPHAAEALAALLTPGSMVTLRGDGVVTEHGTIMSVQEIGSSVADLRPVGISAKRKHSRQPKHQPRHPDGDADV